MKRLFSSFLLALALLALVGCGARGGGGGGGGGGGSGLSALDSNALWIRDNYWGPWEHYMTRTQPSRSCQSRQTYIDTKENLGLKLDADRLALETSLALGKISLSAYNRQYCLVIRDYYSAVSSALGSAGQEGYEYTNFTLYHPNRSEEGEPIADTYQLVGDDDDSASIGDDDDIASDDDDVSDDDDGPLVMPTFRGTSGRRVGVNGYQAWIDEVDCMEVGTELPAWADSSINWQRSDVTDGELEVVESGDSARLLTLTDGALTADTSDSEESPGEQALTLDETFEYCEIIYPPDF